MSTDTQQRDKIRRLNLNLTLSRRIAEYLLSQDSDRFNRVSIAADEGRIILQGWVPSETARQDAAYYVKQVAGVRVIENELKVDLLADVSFSAQARRRFKQRQKFLAPAAVIAFLVVSFAAWRFVPVALAWLPANQEYAPSVQVYPVSLQIFYEGQPATGVSAVLYPVTELETDQFVPRPMGTVDSLGRLRLRTFQPDDGVPVGTFKVTLQWRKQVIDGEDVHEGPNILPAKYANPGTTPFLIVAKPGMNKCDPIQLTDCR